MEASWACVASEVCSHVRVRRGKAIKMREDESIKELMKWLAKENEGR